jgi:hypothetical protein
VKKFILTECKICGKKLNSRGFSFHCKKTHNISVEDYIVKYEYDGVPPKCKCGCNSPVSIRSYQVMEYANHHSPAGKIVVGEFRERDEEKWSKNISKSRKKFCQDNPEKMLGKNNNFYGKKHTKKTKDIIRERTYKQMKDGKHPLMRKFKKNAKKTSLEKKFENYLKIAGIEYEYNFQIEFVSKFGTIANRYYDFYIPSKNKLFELHGSYWHPKEKNQSLNKIQLKNFDNDIFKKQLAKERGHDLVAIYDHELDEFIKNNSLLNKDISKLTVEY